MNIDRTLEFILKQQARFESNQVKFESNFAKADQRFLKSRKAPGSA